MSVTKIDKNYRIVIDKKTRTKLGLKTGDSLILIPSGKEIRLIPVKNNKTFIGSLTNLNYDPDDHKATELLLREGSKSSHE
jgi:AbrB family looped-hinge helix DNA binding protein